MKKHLISNLKGDFVAIPESRSKSKPRDIEMSEYMVNYILERDRVLWRAGLSRDELKEKYGK